MRGYRSFIAVNVPDRLRRHLQYHNEAIQDQ
jgi:hypothetical protein